MDLERLGPEAEVEPVGEQRALAVEVAAAGLEAVAAVRGSEPIR